MSRFRFTIAGFFLVLTLVAFGLAALVSQSSLAGSAAYTIFVGLICLAVAGAIARPMPTKAFWLGFAIFGWVYWQTEFETETPARSNFVFSIGGFYSSPTSADTRRPGLVTRELLHIVANNLTVSRSVGSKVMGQWRGGSYYSGTISEVEGDQYLIVWDDGSAPQWTPATGIRPSSPTVLVAGHSLLGGLFALLGGVLAAVLFGASSTKPQATAVGKVGQDS